MKKPANVVHLRPQPGQKPKPLDKLTREDIVKASLALLITKVASALDDVDQYSTCPHPGCQACQNVRAMNAAHAALNFFVNAWSVVDTARTDLGKEPFYARPGKLFLELIDALEADDEDDNDPEEPAA